MKLVILVLLIILFSFALICYYYFSFPRDFYTMVSNAMLHDNSTEAVHYQWLENNLNYSRSYIDSWSLKNGFPPGSLVQIEKMDCSQIKIGDVIIYSIGNSDNPSGEISNMPVIHRVIKINSDGAFMTKGDHNNALLSFELSIKCSNVLGKVINIS